LWLPVPATSISSMSMAWAWGVGLAHDIACQLALITAVSDSRSHYSLCHYAFVERKMKKHVWRTQLFLSFIIHIQFEYAAGTHRKTQKISKNIFKKFYFIKKNEKKILF
jgi:hypothetical protein